MNQRNWINDITKVAIPPIGKHKRLSVWTDTHEDNLNQIIFDVLSFNKKEFSESCAIKVCMLEEGEKMPIRKPFKAHALDNRPPKPFTRIESDQVKTFACAVKIEDSPHFLLFKFTCAYDHYVHILYVKNCFIDAVLPHQIPTLEEL